MLELFVDKGDFKYESRQRTEILEFKKTTGELRDAMDDICGILNKHGEGKLYFGVKPNGELRIILLTLKVGSQEFILHTIIQLIHI